MGVTKVCRASTYWRKAGRFLFRALFTSLPLRLRHDAPMRRTGRLALRSRFRSCLGLLTCQTDCRQRGSPGGRQSTRAVHGCGVPHGSTWEGSTSNRPASHGVRPCRVRLDRLPPNPSNSQNHANLDTTHTRSHACHADPSHWASSVPPDAFSRLSWGHTTRTLQGLPSRLQK